jgi:putative phosphoribosyl transferase
MSGGERYRDRSAAGRTLARALEEYAGGEDLLVLGLPRGGVPVAYEVARALRAPLDLFLVRKLALPGDEDVAMGAIASGGVRFVDQGVTDKLGIADDVIARVAAEEQEEIERRNRVYRGERPEPAMEGRTVLLVDDGLTTGASMRAAAIAIGAQGPDRLVLAVPVGPAETVDSLQELADRVVCPLVPGHFESIGEWYDEFESVTDDEVRQIMDRADRTRP